MGDGYAVSILVSSRMLPSEASKSYRIAEVLRAVARSLMVVSHMEALVSLQDVQLILLVLASS